MAKLGKPLVMPDEIVHYSEWVYAVRNRLAECKLLDLSNITVTVHWPKSPLQRWRRVQLVKWLIEEKDIALDQVEYDESGTITHLRAPPAYCLRRSRVATHS